MANNHTQFKRDWELEADLAFSDINNAITKTMIYGWNLVTAATPVDTGRARGSWLLTVNVLGYETLDYVKPKRNSEGDKVQQYPNPPMPVIPDFDVEADTSFYLSNAVNYIEFLEYGTDKITPFGMVTGSLPKMSAHLSKQFKKLDNKRYG